MSTSSHDGKIATAKRCFTTCCFSAMLLIALVCIGCGETGPKLVDAGGTVTYKGNPVPGASLTFAPNGTAPPGIAKTDDQGKFKVTSEGKPGLVVGEYRVGITAAKQKRPITDAEAATITPEQVEANTEYLIPKTYAALQTSGLTATVTDDPAKNNFTFDLK